MKIQTPSKKQQIILAFPFMKNYQSLICDGAIRSGKTSLMTVAFIDWAMREYDNTNFGICGKTVGSAIKNIITPYMSLSYSKKYNIYFTRSDNKMIVRYGRKTNTFYIYGGKDKSSYMLIQGITLGGILFDEVALMERSFVEQGMARCSISGSKFWFNCNPENPNHWFYKEWIKSENHNEKNILYVHFLMTDNPSLSAETLERYNRTHTGLFHDRYIKGKWVRAEGVIYTVFANDNEKYVADIPQKRYQNVYIGIDWGLSNVTASIAVGIAGNNIDILGECVFDMRKTDTESAYKNLANFTKNISINYGNPSILCETYEAMNSGFKNTLLRQHINFKSIKTVVKQEIVDRIEYVSMLFAQDYIKIDKSCKKLISSLNSAVWDESKHNDVRLDLNDGTIDPLDALEYALSDSISNYMKSRRGIGTMNKGII